MKRNVIILLSVFLILAVLMLSKKTEYNKNAYPDLNQNQACSEESKMCPDGSYVGRTGANCSFAACPKTQSAVSDTDKKDSNTDEPIIVGDSMTDTAPGAPNEPEAVFCTMEAKMCPDGSYVGRIGPKCEFTACPALGQNESNTEPSIESVTPGQDLGQTKDFDGIQITPISIKEDSRCKAGTQCIWAGRLIVVTKIEKTNSSTTFASQLGKIISSNTDIEMGVPYAYEGKTVTLVSELDGKFVFEVK